MEIVKPIKIWILISVITVAFFPPVSTLFDNHAVAAVAENFELDETAPVAIYDPHEKFNRSMFALNDKIYFYALKPVSTVYAAYLPPDVRIAVRNTFHNLLFPVRFINCLLQGKGNKAGNEVARFLINSTMGAGGLFDWANRGFGLQRDDEDFGQTLAVWGAGPGAYLVMPLIGPTNGRDLGGYIVDSAMDPIYWMPGPIWMSTAVVSGEVVNNTSLRIGEYENFKKSAIDPYISLRSAYYQYRAKEIAK